MCGYTIPHPAENQINVRLQAKAPDASAVDLLRASLADVKSVAEHILDTFEAALEDDIGDM